MLRPFFALASPELSVEAITTIYGNGPVETSTQNTLRILKAADRLEIPVYQGQANPCCATPFPVGPLRSTAMTPWATLIFPFLAALTKSAVSTLR